MSSSEYIYFTKQGLGKPLLLIHGLMATGEMFQSITKELAKQYCLIIPDLRGCGKSRNLPPPYTVKQQAMDLAQLLDHLGIESIDVLGYSQGGPVAQQLALDYPKRVNHLILSNTYAYNMNSLSEKIEGYITPLLIRILGMRRFAQFVISLGLKHVSKERSKRIVAMIASQDRDIMIQEWKGAMAFDSRNRLTEITCPTLVIAGADDNAVPMHHANMLHSGIKGSKLVIIEHADHALVWTHPTELVDEILRFLEA